MRKWSKRGKWVKCIDGVVRRPARCLQPSERLILGKFIIGVTVQPAFTRFGRTHYRVLHGLKVPGSMLVGGEVAAEGNAAGLAGAQVHPMATRFDAFFAYVRLGLFGFAGTGDVGTDGVLGIHK
jgi:hypothetical protein